MPKGIYKRKPLTKEHRKNISKSLTNRIFSENHKKNLSISNTGKHPTQEALENLSKSHLGQIPWNKNKTGVYSKETLESMSKNKIEHPNKVFKDTKIELKVEEELKKRGINYKKQVSLCSIAIVDFYLPEYKIIIEADGCYYHNCPIHGSGEIKNCTKKDKNKDLILISNGYNIYRFWEHDINKSVEKCINTIVL